MQSDKVIKIGAVSYLNTKPLVHNLEQLAPQAEIIYDLPSRLADGLAAGRLDVALIPSIEYFDDPSYSIISDVCIGCRGPVLSVKLLSRVPFASIGSLALDVGSRTSVALARILLKERFGVEPRLETLPIGMTATEARADAVLLIGDRAIHPPMEEFEFQWDLGDQWCRWSELPFVFAMWTARNDTDLSGIDDALRAARDSGVHHLEEIARSECDASGMTFDDCLAYLRDNLHFFLGPRERQGLELFYRHACEIGLAPEKAELRFNGCEVAR
jgi:chorismate dehydratase